MIGDKWTDVVPYREEEWHSWWTYVRCHPRAAMDHPLWGLMLLAEPECWLEIEAECIGNWISQYADQLREPEAYHWACDCVEHALIVLREELERCPDTITGITLLLSETRDWITAQRDDKETQDFRAGRSRYARAENLNTRREHPTVSKIWHACETLYDLPSSFNRHREEPAHWCSGAIQSHKGHIASGRGRCIEEERWQWRQLQHYLPPYKIQRHPLVP